MQPRLIVTLDWSAAGRPCLGADSIWLGMAGPDRPVTAMNLPTRLAAEARLIEILNATAPPDAAQAPGCSVLVVADFAFGGPAGLARTLTGQPEGLALWPWLAARITETADNATNHRQVAAAMNRDLAVLQTGVMAGGPGPFWGNATRSEIADLPRRKPPLPPTLAEFRLAEMRDRAAGGRPKALWQLAGAGAVGAQSLTGIAMLERVRQRFAGRVAVWPFQPPTAPIVLAEGYFSMLPDAVRTEAASGGLVRDAAQVRVMARVLQRLATLNALPALFAPDAPADILHEEGWYLAAGTPERLRQALD